MEQHAQLTKLNRILSLVFAEKLRITSLSRIGLYWTLKIKEFIPPHFCRSYRDEKEEKLVEATSVAIQLKVLLDINFLGNTRLVPSMR